jgi:hypothetical protein
VDWLKTVDVVEARTHRIDLTGGPEQPSLAALVNRVSLGGERLLLVRYGTVVAEIRTPDPSPEAFVAPRGMTRAAR